jgi:hypothetical protein
MHAATPAMFLHRIIDVLHPFQACTIAACMPFNTHQPTENIAPLIYIFRFFPIATPGVTTSMISPMSLAAI